MQGKPCLPEPFRPQFHGQVRPALILPTGYSSANQAFASSSFV